MATISPKPVSNRERALIAAELERLFECPEFRQSEQSKKLLKHLVEQSFEDSPALLRERAIGVTVFGLEPGYDTAENPIVRVRINEVRKRLAKHNQQAPHAAVRFEIPGGGYRVDFHLEDPSQPPMLTEAVEVPAAASVVPSVPRRLPRAVIIGGLLLVAAMGAMLHRARSRDLVEQFWGPALDARAPVVLCSGHPVVYRFSREMQEKIRGSSVDHFQGQTLEFRPPADSVLHGRDVVAVPDQYIGLGSAMAIAQLYGWLQRERRDADIRFGNDLTFTDLRKSPAVLIGAYQNRWTIEFMRGLRFVFGTKDGAPVVRDMRDGREWSLPGLQENGQTKEDYVLITRLLRSPSGEFMIAAAGITQYGGQTVAEVLTKPDVMQAMLRGASSGWASKNLQLLMKIQVIGRTAGPPTLVALHEW